MLNLGVNSYFSSWDEILHARGHKHYFWGAQAPKCTPVAPGQLLSFGAQSSLGGHTSRLEGTSGDLEGHGPEMPPRVAGPVASY